MSFGIRENGDIQVKAVLHEYLEDWEACIEGFFVDDEKAQKSAAILPFQVLLASEDNQI